MSLMKQTPRCISNLRIGNLCRAFLRTLFFRYILWHLFGVSVIICIPLWASAQKSIAVKTIALPKPFDHAEIKHMMLDNEGFLWFVTNQGIWRFDGTDVQPVDVHSPALPQNSVPDGIYRYHNFLFFSLNNIPTESFRVLCYDIGKKTIRQYQMPGRPMNYLVNNVGALSFMTTDGSKWVFTDSGGLKQSEKYFTRKGWIKTDGMEYYTVDSNGNTYVFSHKKIGLIKKDSVIWSAPITSPKNLAFVRWAYCTSKYVFAYSGNATVVYDKNTLQIAFEHFDETYNLSLPPKEGAEPIFKLVNDLRVQCTCDELGSNKKMFGTDKGLLEISPSFNTPAASDLQQQVVDFFKDKSVRSIYRSPTDKLYVGTYQGHFVYDGNSFKKINNYIAYTVQPVNENVLLVGMEGGAGFFTVDTRTDKCRLNPDQGHAIGTTKIIKYKNGYLAGANGYLYYLTELPNGDYKVDPWLQDSNLGIVKDLRLFNGELWIASVEGLYKVSKQGRATKVYPANRSQGCYAILPDNDGLWVGTNGEGLIKIDAAGKINQQIHFGDGLAGEYVYSLLQLDKLVIAGTSGGISIFDRSAGMQPLTIPDLPPSAGSLYQEFNHSAVFDDVSKRSLIFGGTQGLTFLDEDYLESFVGKPDDKVRLSYIKRGYNTSRPTATDIFVSGNDAIEILPGNTFTGLKFSGSLSQNYVLFRIRELGTKWQQGKLSDEVSLFAIPPGKYTLEVRFPSVTDRRYWLTKTIIVVPHFYQTWLFDFLVVLLAALLIYLAWLARLRKIRDEHLLRTTIASDLHDEIGSALTRISFSSELMNIKQQLDSSVVEKISVDSKGAIASISDIIWSVDARNDNTDDLLLRIREHAGNMLENAAALHFDARGLERVTTLPQLVRQNIYLVFKEAINNIARHNVSPEVWISLDNQPGGMAIIIKNSIDTGKERSIYTGQGLRNMQMRAKRIKAKLDISNDGTIFCITIRMRRW
jgi:signal transduction histidine kinase